MLQKLFLLIILSSLLLMNPNANAGYNSYSKTPIILNNSSNLFPRNYYTIEVFNQPSISESKFTLRLGSSGEVSGCAETGKNYVDIKKAHHTLRITVIDSEIILDRHARYNNYGCNNKKSSSFFDIEFDKNALIRNEIKDIELKSVRYGNFGKMDINVNQDKIEISRGNFLSTFWFLPTDSVILHVPNAKSDYDVRSMITEFALSHHLVPMGEIIDGFMPPDDAGNYVLFNDPRRNIVSKLNANSKSIIVGEIYPTKTIYNALGSKKKTHKLDIYAVLPGENK